MRGVAAVVVAFGAPVGSLFLGPVTFVVDLIAKCLSAGVLTGVWLERGATLNEPKSGVPTSVPQHRDKATFQMRMMIGIDPHKASHTAVVIDDNEVMLDKQCGPLMLV